MTEIEQLRILKSVMLEHAERFQVLKHVYDLNLSDCWVGAGFVRNAIWDQIHGIRTSVEVFDIDVIFFDPAQKSREFDLSVEEKLRALAPKYDWSVKNQARMHERNGDQPYASCLGSISKWPETATSIAVRLTPASDLEFIAPFGLGDIFQLIVKPTPHFKTRLNVVSERADKHRWLSRWPRLEIRA